MKYSSQAMTVIAANGFPTGEGHLDSMAKVPYHKMASDKSKPQGFTNTRVDGQPALVEQSHSFPLSERCLLSTGGVVICEVPKSGQTFEDGAKPQIPMPKPVAMDLYLRPYKFMEDGGFGLHGGSLRLGSPTAAVAQRVFCQARVRQWAWVRHL